METVQTTIETPTHQKIHRIGWDFHSKVVNIHIMMGKQDALGEFQYIPGRDYSEQISGSEYADLFVAHGATAESLRTALLAVLKAKNRLK
jgi:hypothetical protein